MRAIAAGEKTARNFSSPFLPVDAMQLSHASPHTTLSHEGDFRPLTIAVLFAVLMTAASIPIATHPLPPLADYVNHLARTHVIDAIGSDPDLTRYYRIDWQILPNLMIDLVVPVLHQFMSVYLAGQIFTVTAFILIVSGTFALNRALIGRWSALPLITLPLLYNGVLFVGVMNYVFGIGLALWGLAAWVALRDRRWPWRFAASTLFVLTLFVCHLFAAGLYGLGLLAIELQRLWAKRAEPLWPRLADFCAAGLPFIPFIALLLAGPTWSAPGAPAFWEMAGKIEGLKLAINAYYPLLAYALVALAAAAAFYARYRSALHFHPAGWAILVVSVIIYMAMPRALFAAHMADQRLPIAVAFMLIACIDVNLSHRTLRRGFVALAMLLLAARVIEVQLVWNHLAPSTEAFFKSVQSIKRGARVLVVYGDRSANKEISDFGLVHAASLATIERSALVTTAFTVHGKQILHVRKEFHRYVETEDRLPPTVPYFIQVADRVSAGKSSFCDLWPRHFDYVYILFTTKSARNPDMKHLEFVDGGAGFQLYRIIQPAKLAPLR